jgi:hypothetical protein
MLLFAQERFWKCGCKDRVITERFMDRNEDRRNTQFPIDWRSLAERASVEKDPEKLVNLALQLESVLAEQQRTFSDWKSREDRPRERHSN